MRYRAKYAVVNPSGKQIGITTHEVKAKNRQGALTKLRKLVTARLPKKKNVEEGSWKRGFFEPYRRSADYSRVRAGEPPLKRGKKAATRRYKGKMKKARRGRTSIS